MTCPVCVPRYAHLIDPGCPACRGEGRLVLGAAVAKEPAFVVARAVELYLDEFSYLERLGTGTSDPQGWSSVQIATDALVDAGLLAPLPPPSRSAEPYPSQQQRGVLGRRAKRIAKALGARLASDTHTTTIFTDDGTIERTYERPRIPVDELSARRAAKQ